MSDAPADYARYGRQIALPELGEGGQRRLAATAVRFEPDGALVREAHRRAGGRVAADAAIVVALPEGTIPGAASRGVAAWASIEAARRVLGQCPRGMPEGLLARLSG